MYQMLEQVKQGQGNPINLLKQITNNYTPEQMQNFYGIAQQIGFPNEFLMQIQSEIK